MAWVVLPMVQLVSPLNYGWTTTPTFIKSSVCGLFQRSGTLCVRVGVNKGCSVKVVNNGDMLYSSSELHPLRMGFRLLMPCDHHTKHGEGCLPSEGVSTC